LYGFEERMQKALSEHIRLLLKKLCLYVPSLCWLGLYCLEWVSPLTAGFKNVCGDIFSNDCLGFLSYWWVLPPVFGIGSFYLLRCLIDKKMYVFAGAGFFGSVLYFMHYFWLYVISIVW
jgi:hypothetical protein